jgi:hypothetical protein
MEHNVNQDIYNKYNDPNIFKFAVVCHTDDDLKIYHELYQWLESPISIIQMFSSVDEAAGYTPNGIILTSNAAQDLHQVYQKSEVLALVCNADIDDMTLDRLFQDYDHLHAYQRTQLIYSTGPKLMSNLLIGGDPQSQTQLMTIFDDMAKYNKDIVTMPSPFMALKIFELLESYNEMYAKWKLESEESLHYLQLPSNKILRTTLDIIKNNHCIKSKTAV